MIEEKCRTTAAANRDFSSGEAAKFRSKRRCGILAPGAYLP
jgi:hypothetical protein